VRSGAL